MKKSVLLLLGIIYIAVPASKTIAQENPSGKKVSYKSEQDITYSELVPFGSDGKLCTILKVTAKQTECIGTGSIDCQPGASITKVETIGYTTCE